MIQQLIDMRETVRHVIFIDLRKEYYSLDRECCIDILAVYGVDPRTIHILQTYWVRNQMAWDHHGSAFQSHCGVTQGYPLSPMIFNVVIDAVIRNWVTLVGTRQRAPDEMAWERQSSPYWRSSTLMTDLSHRPRAPAFRERLTPWRASLTGWASRTKREKR